MIRQRTRIKRTVAPRKSRGVRKGPWRSEKYRQWIASQPCVICGFPNTQAAHTEHNGMSSKGSDASCLPLCPFHHDQLDGRRDMNGHYGKRAFEKAYGISLAGGAAAMFSVWCLDHRKPEAECSCRFAGDQADATGCEAHGVNAERPESPHVVNVRVKGESDACPF